MQRWEILGRAKVPDGGGELSLHRRDKEYLINVDGHLLMTNFGHASEDALAELGCAKIAGLARPSILVGGLGMGYTSPPPCATAARTPRSSSRSSCPRWWTGNRGYLSHLAGHPLRDKRVVVLQEDLAHTLRREQGRLRRHFAGRRQRTRGA